MALFFGGFVAGIIFCAILLGIGVMRALRALREGHPQ